MGRGSVAGGGKAYDVWELPAGAAADLGAGLGGCGQDAAGGFPGRPAVHKRRGGGGHDGRQWGGEKRKHLRCMGDSGRVT